MRKLLTFTISLQLFCYAVKAQSIADLNAPRIISPAPEAAALGKYGQIPVDKSTGIPDISVPLYEIKTPRFTLPVSLSYHASGIKVSEMSTWVGAGWSLNAGGVITRSIIGLADDGQGGLLSNTTSLSAQMATFNQTPNAIPYGGSMYLFENVCEHSTEYQPDNFFYNFAGNTGAFVFGPDAAHTPVLTPYKPLVITYSQPVQYAPGTFKVLDENGNTYYFNNSETAGNSSYQSTYADSWYLTQMISADKSDTLTFQYQADTQMSAQAYPVYTQSYTYTPSTYYGDFVQGSGCQIAGVTGFITPGVNITDFYNPLYIKTILFRGGRVDFIAKSGRMEGTQNYYGPHLSLDSVIVSNYDFNKKTYTRLKSFKIYTGYWYNPLPNYPLTNPPVYSGSPYRLRLDSIAENDLNNTAIKTHKFGYDPVAPPPVNYLGQDHWGFYNGQGQNQTLLQQQQSVDLNGNLYTIGNANRNPSPANMTAGMLEQITYPTGGYTIFSYEPHQYYKYSNGTLPQRSLTANSAGYYAPTSTATFTTDTKTGGTYGANISCSLNDVSGVSTAPPTVELIQTSNNAIIYQQSNNTNTQVVYNAVVRLQPGQQYELYASSPGGSANSTPLPVAAITVAYQVNAADSAMALGIGGGLRIHTIKNYNSNGGSISTETYKYGLTENGGGILMNDTVAFADTLDRVYWSEQSTTTYPYNTTVCSGLIKTYSSNPTYALSTLSGSPVAYSAVTIYHGDTINNIGKSRYEYVNYPDSLLQTPTSYENGVMTVPVSWKNGQAVHEAHYRNSSGAYLLEQEKYTVYSLVPRSSAMGIYVGYRYEAKGFTEPNWPSSTVVYSPPGGSYQNVKPYLYFSYPISTGSAVPARTVTINYANDGATVLTQDTVKYYYDNHAHMFPTRIISYDGKGDSLLKQVQYPQDMSQSGIYGTMSAPATNIISPAIEVTESQNGTQLEQSVINYGNSNPGSIINPASVSLQVLTNAAETRLSYPSYDSQGNLLTVLKPGGPPVSYIWGYKGEYPTAEVKDAPASDIFYESFEDDGLGNSAYGSARTGHYSSTSGFSKTLSGLDNGSYILSYWLWNGTAWALQTATETVTNGSYPISLSGQVDDIRFYPAAAQMTSYTYDPLIGITSVTDAKGEVSYYQYDTLQRLQNITDQYGNVIKHFTYHYQAP